MKRGAAIAASGLFALLAAALTITALATEPGAGSDPPPSECACELRSWIVAGQARHLFLKIDCPPELAELSTVVEFTSAALRADFAPPASGAIDPAPIAMMTRGNRLRPALGPPDNRLEAAWTIDAKQAACLQRDRVFERAYFLLGPNSNSGMRAACEACGLELPPHVVGGEGLLSEFPGVGMDPGEERAAADWAARGAGSRD